MSLRCQFDGCNRKTTSKKDKFCLKHAKQTLKALAASGYFQPLEVTTIDGTTRLSNREFLTDLETSMGASEKNSSD